MDLTVIAVGLVAPAAFWIGWLYYKDRVKPEPLGGILLTYVLGIAEGWAGLQLYDLSVYLGLPDDPFLLSETDRFGFFAYVVGFVGVVEELVKVVPFAVVVLRLRAFDETIDGIVYASVIALGYATYENILYLPDMEGWARYGRAFAAPLVHTIFSSIWGYSIAKARLQGRHVLPAALNGIALAALVHGLYDFLATDPRLQPGTTVAIAVVWLWRMRTIRRLHAEQRAADAASSGSPNAPAKRQESGGTGDDDPAG